jgi:4-carboxymuconolactone decarboxylase
MSENNEISDVDAGRRERGLKMFNEVYGGIVPVPPADKQGPFFHQTIDQLFAETWSRPNMSIKERRLVTLGAVAALGETEMFEIQLRAAIKKGELTKAQIEDLVLFLPAYIGYPRTSKILMISQKIFAEMEGTS